MSNRKEVITVSIKILLINLYLKKTMQNFDVLETKQCETKTLVSRKQHCQISFVIIRNLSGLCPCQRNMSDSFTFTCYS